MPEGRSNAEGAASRSIGAPGELTSPPTDDGGSSGKPSLAPAGPKVRSTQLSFGKYRLIASIGHGGMADVYLAVSSGPAGFSKLQVIKQLRPLLADEPELRTMFLDEARLAARLNHKNVVQTNEVGVEDGTYFIAMEYLDGQPLSRVLHQARKSGAGFSLAAHLRVLCEMLGGLHYAHDVQDYDGTPLNIVHRDVTPQNVFITYDGQVKLVDFGIAKAEGRESETKAGVIKGKIAYMAPEQAFAAHTQRPIDRRADVYAAGVMLWEAIAGRRLFKGLGDAKIIAELIKGAPKIEEVVPDVPEELARISHRALARDPRQRYASAAELRADLERHVAGMAEKVTPEELGALTSAMFVEQRAEMRTIIERQLAEMRQSRGPTARDAGAQDAPVESRTRLSASLAQGDSCSVSGPIPKLLGADGGPARGADLGLETPISATSTPPSSLGPGALTAASVVPSGTATATRSRALVAIAALGGLALLGAIGGSLSLRGAPVAVPSSVSAASSPPQVESPPEARALVVPDATTVIAAPSPLAEASASVPDGAFIHIKIAVNPLEGRILVDGSALPANPFDGRFPRDGAFHRLQFEAPGFLLQKRLAVFDKDYELSVALLPKPKTDEGASPASGTTAAKPNPYGD